MTSRKIKTKMPLRLKDTKFSQRFKYQNYTLSETFPECRDKSSLCVFPDRSGQVVAEEGFSEWTQYCNSIAIWKSNLPDASS